MGTRCSSRVLFDASKRLIGSGRSGSGAHSAGTEDGEVVVVIRLLLLLLSELRVSNHSSSCVPLVWSPTCSLQRGSQARDILEQFLPGRAGLPVAKEYRPGLVQVALLDAPP